jgi:DNA-binding MarR family transcriptional regulator
MNVVTDPVTLANELRPVLLKLSRQLRHEVHARGLSTSQVSLLIQIAKQPGICVGDLAALERMSSPGMSKAVQKLLEEGLVRREQATPDDRRRVAVQITARGRDVLASVRRRRTAWLADRLQRLEPDELERLEAAIEPLAKLLEATE